MPGEFPGRTGRRAILRGAALGLPSALAFRPDAAAAGAGQRAPALTGPYQLRNPYISLAGENGVITSLAFDPGGAGDYGENLLAPPGWYFQLSSDGAVLTARSSQASYQITASSLDLTIPVYNHVVVSQTETSNGYDIAIGGGAGQTFTAPSVAVSQLGISLFPAFGARPTGNLSVRILTGGPGGQQVFAADVTPSQLPMPSGGMVYIALPGLLLRAGSRYFIDLSTTDQAWALQYEAANVYPGGEFYGFGMQPQPDKDLTFELLSPTGDLEYRARWHITMDGRRLTSELTLTPLAAHTITRTGFEWTTAWEQSGYDSSDPATTPFTRFFDDLGQYLPIQQFKRRPAMFGPFSFDIGTHSAYAPSAARQWIHCSGQRGYDLEFGWPDIVLHWAMGPALMSYRFYQSGYAPASTLERKVTGGQSIAFPFCLSVLPAGGPVPGWYPRFSSSDPLVDAHLTSFYWDRAFSWYRGAVGTDWCDWEGRILDWQGGPLRSGQRDLLESITVAPDGYVWTWNPPGQEAWPFPGPPYDSRHFTTNAMYILGISHYFSWTGDLSFLATMLPRAEAAMGYYLTQLGGDSGLVTIDRGDVGSTGRPAHTGQDGSPGTNYWDITSYGWKDAYTNLYFYAAAGVLADLEEAARRPREAASLRALQPKIRRAYNRAFWREASLPDGRHGGRYVQTIDQRGSAKDHGATYLNLEAMVMGLPTPAQGRAILQWLDHGETELTTNLVLLSGGGPRVPVSAGGTLAQEFHADDPFSHVAGQFFTSGSDTAAMTLSLYAGAEPPGKLVAQRRIEGVYNGWFAELDSGIQPAGTYYLEVSAATGGVSWTASPSAYPGGRAYRNGAPLSSPAALTLVVVSEHHAGPSDIYAQWGWAPRTTTRKNNFYYVWEWAGVTVPWGAQLQDGGADLYEVGFDIVARSRYSSATDAFARMAAVLQRYALPDRLCGGAPLYAGENPQNELQAGSVGVDVPFPESGLAPASFLPAFIGLAATPQGLYLMPNLPEGMEWAAVEGVNYRGHELRIRVTRDQIEIGSTGFSLRRRYRAGERITVAVPGATDGPLGVQHSHLSSAEPLAPSAVMPGTRLPADS